MFTFTFTKISHTIPFSYEKFGNSNRAASTVNTVVTIASAENEHRLESEHVIKKKV